MCLSVWAVGITCGALYLNYCCQNHTWCSLRTDEHCCERLLNSLLRCWIVFPEYSPAWFSEVPKLGCESPRIFVASRESVGSCRGWSGQEAGGRVMSCLCEQLLSLSLCWLWSRASHRDQPPSWLPCFPTAQPSEEREGWFPRLFLKVLLCLCSAAEVPLGHWVTSGWGKARSWSSSFVRTVWAHHWDCQAKMTGDLKVGFL